MIDRNPTVYERCLIDRDERGADLASMPAQPDERQESEGETDESERLADALDLLDAWSDEGGRA